MCSCACRKFMHWNMNHTVHKNHLGGPFKLQKDTIISCLAILYNSLTSAISLQYRVRKFNWNREPTKVLSQHLPAANGMLPGLPFLAPYKDFEKVICEKTNIRKSGLGWFINDYQNRMNRGCWLQYNCWPWKEQNWHCPFRTEAHPWRNHRQKHERWIKPRKDMAKIEGYHKWKQGKYNMVYWLVNFLNNLSANFTSPWLSAFSPVLW